jgi:hypothetical protein
VLGIEVLRRQTAREFPNAERGETAARMRATIASARQRRTGAAKPTAKT